MPWNGDPSGAFLAPLALLALVFSNKRKRGKWDSLLIVLVVGLALGVSLSACGGGGTSTEPAPVSDPIPPETTPGTGTTSGAGTDTGYSSSSSQSPTVIVTYTCTVTPSSIPSPTPTITPTPTLIPPLSYAQMFYNAVINNSRSLPPRFSSALLLAMGEQESGGNIEPYRNSTTDGGALQLRYPSGHRSMDIYPDTPEGYEQNVTDAIAVIKDGYNAIEKMQGNFWDYLVELYPEEHVVDVVRSVLYYNGGYNWVENYRDPKLNLNEGYLGAVARQLESNVPIDFPGQSDQGLVKPLKSAQHMVDCAVDPNNPSCP